MLCAPREARIYWNNSSVLVFFAPPIPKDSVEQTGDRLDVLLAEYEHRKQDETQRQVQRALRLEETRKVGAEHLRRFVVESARNVAERLQAAGHRVVYQEFLDAYPPSVRIHLWPKPGALDDGEPKRTTFEMVWGEPNSDSLCAMRWSEGLHRMEQQGSARAGVVDELWAREQLLSFVRETLDGA